MPPRTRRRTLAHPVVRPLVFGAALWGFVVPLVDGEGPVEVFGGLFGAWACTILALWLISRSEDSGDV